MKLHYYKPDEISMNFGDEINAELWKYYFGDFFDDNDNEVFFGIGTILRAAQKKYPESKIVIFGSGCHKVFYRIVNEHKIYFVRGVLTAKALGIEKSLAITDPALLIDELYPPENFDREKYFEFGYIPHFSTDNNSYKEVIESLGYLYISPNSTPKEVIRKILHCKCILSEAMHGAIVSDTYGVPWIPVYSYKSFNIFKWEDWLSNLGIKVKFNKLPRLYDKQNKFKSYLKNFLFKYRLLRITKSQHYLSSKKLKEKLKEELKDKIQEFKSDYLFKN